MPDSESEIRPLTPSDYLQVIKEIGVLDLDHIENGRLNKRYIYQ